MKYILLFLIRFYQKYISPYKGYNCAHRIATGEISCSAYGYKVISRYGVFKGYALLKLRFYDCRWHAQNNTYKRLAHQNQRGDCDCGIDADCCDGGSKNNSFDCTPNPGCGNDSDKKNQTREKRNKKKYYDREI